MRPCKALRGGLRQAKVYSNKKVFTIGNILYLTLLKQAKSLGPVRGRLYLRFLLSLPQTADAKYIIQVLGGDTSPKLGCYQLVPFAVMERKTKNLPRVHPYRPYRE